jgi:hypothetical protein
MRHNSKRKFIGNSVLTCLVGKFHDQRDAIGRPGVGLPQGVFSGFSYF